MTNGNRRACVIITVDLPGTEPLAPARDTALLELAQRHRIPATWVLHHFTPQSLQRLQAGPLPHEAALLADPWLPEIKDRRQLAQQLIRGVSLANQHRLRLSTIGLRAANAFDDPEQLGLLAKSGITLLRVPFGRARRVLQPVRPATRRHGICALDTSVVLPTSSPWSLRRAARQLRRIAERSDSSQHAFHLAIDGQLLADARRSLPREITQLFEVAAEARDAGLLEFATLQAYAQRRRQQSSSSAGGSILRAA